MNIEDQAGMEQNILNAAEGLFLEQGFAKTTTTQIAHRVGCNQALVHYYFRNKERLFQQVFERKIQYFISTFFKIQQSEGSFTEKLRKKIDAHYDLLVESPRLPILLLSEIVTNPERSKQIQEHLLNYPLEIISSFQQLIDQEVERGGIRPVRAIDLMLNILSLNAGSVVAIYLMKTTLNAEPKAISEYIKKRKEDIIETILRSLQPNSMTL